jgi:SAM-dependent methyltransferase
MVDAKPHDPYADIADLYDLEHASFADDVDFYRGFVTAVGDPVLELGCGSGRLLLALSGSGFRITGIDRSQAMLDLAARAVRRRGLETSIALHRAEMAEADLVPGGPFGVVFVALNGLMHLSEARDQRRVLQSARNALDPRGLLLVDVLNPTPEALRSFDHSLVHEGTWALEDGTRVDKFATRRVSPASQTIQTDLWYDLTAPDGRLRRVATSFPMRYVHAAELELMLELAGFREWQLYGSYELDPFGDQSERLLVAAEVTPS